MRRIFLAFVVIVFLTFPYSAFADAANTERVRLIFDTNCKSCHGAIFNVMDVKDMTDKNIVQGIEGSRLFKAITRSVDWMPKGKDPLSFEDKQSILTWLTEGYPDFNVTPPATSILDENQISRCIRGDAFNSNQEVAKNFLYIQLANYTDDVQRVEEAVNKLLNQVSLSEVAVGKIISCEGVVKTAMRFDLRDINQSREAADDIIVVGQYPYFIDRTGIEGFEEAVQNQKDILRIIRSKTAPYVRADWLIETASRDPVYSNLLFHGVNVRNIEDFEKRFLRVNTQKLLLETEEAKVAIFRRSGVTLYNREVHEYPIDFFGANGIGYHLSYWKTFDVQNDIATRNFFAFPALLYDWYDRNFKFLENKAFVNDATEVIVTGLPGGQFFSLFAGIAEGQGALKEADSAVAQQFENTIHPILGSGGVRQLQGFTGKSGAILNGQSCNSCHSGSMNAFIDEGRSHLDLSTDFSNEQINFFHRSFYENQGQIDAHIKTANASWANSMKLIGAKQTSYATALEPIFATSKAYLNDLDVCQFGAELGFDCNTVKQALSHAPDLARKLGLSEDKGKASRLNVEALQAQIAVDLNLGQAVIFKKGTEPPPPPPPVCHLRVVNHTVYHQRFEKLVFKTATYGPYFLGVGQVQDFEHDSDGVLDACLFYRNDRCVVEKGLSLKKCGSYEIRRGDDGYSKLFETN